MKIGRRNGAEKCGNPCCGRPVVALGLAHDGAALGNGLGGDGEAQVHIGRDFPGVEGRIKAPPFNAMFAHLAKAGALTILEDDNG